jgi:hypothetical protein
VIAQMLERPAALDVHKERVTARVRTPGEGGHGAICLAALGGLAHPGREKKRRALLAARLLLEERPAVVAPGIALALTITSDPATLTWLLGLLGSLDGTDNPVLQTSQDALRQLATRDLLTVRAAARRMITGTPPALASSTLQETARTSDELWTPDDEDDDHKTDPPGLDVLLDAAAGQRIRLGERILPGLRPAVRSRAASVLSSDALKRRLDRQLNAFGDRVKPRWPDAFLAPYETIEEVLQSAAGGGRARLIVSGEPISDPIRWVDALASVIVDDPDVPLTLETHRQPRPPLPSPLGIGHERWAQIRKLASGDTSEGVEEALEKDRLLHATLTLEPASRLLTAQGWPYGGWYWLATVERRTFKHPDWQEKRDLIAKRYRVVEVRDIGDRQALLVPPVGEGDLRLWRAAVERNPVPSSLDSSQPLIGIDREVKMAGDAHEGLGVPDSLLSRVAGGNLTPRRSQNRT